MPVNVTPLFSREHYLAAAEAFLRGIERRIAAGLNPNVGSVASLFINRWDAAITSKVPDTSRISHQSLPAFVAGPSGTFLCSPHPTPATSSVATSRAQRNNASVTALPFAGGIVPNALLLNSICQVLYVHEIGSVLAANRSDPYRMLYEHMEPDSNRLGLFNLETAVETSYGAAAASSGGG